MKYKGVWIGLVIGIISSLFLIYQEISKYSSKFGYPTSYIFTTSPESVLIIIILSMSFWIFVGYLTEKVIKAKNMVIWGAFLGGLVAFFCTILFIELDSAGGLIQLSWITLFGIIFGTSISFIIKKLIKKND